MNAYRQSASDVRERVLAMRREIGALEPTIDLRLVDLPRPVGARLVHLRPRVKRPARDEVEARMLDEECAELVSILRQLSHACAIARVPGEVPIPRAPDVLPWISRTHTPFNVYDVVARSTARFGNVRLARWGDGSRATFLSPGDVEILLCARGDADPYFGVWRTITCTLHARVPDDAKLDVWQRTWLDRVCESLRLVPARTPEQGNWCVRGDAEAFSQEAREALDRLDDAVRARLRISAKRGVARFVWRTTRPSDAVDAAPVEAISAFESIVCALRGA